MSNLGNSSTFQTLLVGWECKCMIGDFWVTSFLAGCLLPAFGGWNGRRWRGRHIGNRARKLTDG